MTTTKRRDPNYMRDLMRSKRAAKREQQIAAGEVPQVGGRRPGAGRKRTAGASVAISRDYLVVHVRSTTPLSKLRPETREAILALARAAAAQLSDAVSAEATTAEGQQL